MFYRFLPQKGSPVACMEWLFIRVTCPLMSEYVNTQEISCLSGVISSDQITLNLQISNCKQIMPRLVTFMNISMMRNGMYLTNKNARQNIPILPMAFLTFASFWSKSRGPSSLDSFMGWQRNLKTCTNLKRPPPFGRGLMTAVVKGWSEWGGCIARGTEKGVGLVFMLEPNLEKVWTPVRETSPM